MVLYVHNARLKKLKITRAHDFLPIGDDLESMEEECWRQQDHPKFILEEIKSHKSKMQN